MVDIRFKVLTIENGILEPDSRYWSLAFTGHTNIEKCYGENQIAKGVCYNTLMINGQGEDSANKLYRQIKKAIMKFIDSNNKTNGCTIEELSYFDGTKAERVFYPGDIKPNKQIRVIVGMARGLDEIAGLVAMDMGLSIVCCVPHTIEWHKNREITNRGRVQALFYERFQNYPNALWYQIKKTYSSGWPFANFARNAAMVDLANKVLSFKCYDSAGTDHCIKLAKKAGKYAGNIPKE